MSYSDHIANAQTDLRSAAGALSEELRAYPTPVSGCDAQYNHMLAERKRVLAALSALDRMPFVATPRTPAPGVGIESR